MIRRTVLYSRDALVDLRNLYDWIAADTGPATAHAYLERLQQAIRRMDIGSERGTRRDDIRPGIRVMGFERRVTIVFSVTDTQVVIVRLAYGGQNWESALAAD